MKKIIYSSSFFVLIINVSFAQKKSSIDSLINLHFQQTVVAQYKPAYKALYSGNNSMSSNEELKYTLTTTLFFGSKLWNNARLYVNPELAGGSGLSSGLGIAGFTNGEAFRIGSPEPKIYLARGYIKQIINLSSPTIVSEEGVNQLPTKYSDTYLTIVAGKFSIADFFDNNKYSHDPRSQFFNWSLMSNGAWDYPANTRGYTNGVLVGYNNKSWSLRYAICQVPKYANGPKMDNNIKNANSNTIEIQKDYKSTIGIGSIKVLAFYTTAHMGNYQQAITNYVNGSDSIADITVTRAYGRTKYGVGMNMEHTFLNDIGIFFRASINDGKNETWAFTEIDNSISGGVVVNGKKWKKEKDNIGFAVVTNGLSNTHKNYLNAGGYGFIIGDGYLNYAHEVISEIYYNFNTLKNLYITPDYQFVINPAYNKDRGPIHVFSFRFHIEF